MNFLNPLFLLGLLAVALPVIIHLINLQRPQKVAFSTLSFFNELRKSTIRRIRIKQYLLLALRTLAVLFLALALARPFLPPTITGSASSGESRSVAILIDNSASMSRVGTDGPLIEQAKDVVDRIITNGNSDDKFLIKTTNATDATTNGFVNSNRAISQLDNITSVNRGHYTADQFKEVYQQLKEAPSGRSVLYIVSDGQVSQLSTLEEIELDDESEAKSVSVQLIQLEEAKQQNVAVKSISLESQLLSPGSPITLSVEVENTGDAAVANQFVSLQVKGEMTGQYETALEPGETKDFLFELIPEEVGYLSGQILLEGDEVDFDNTRHFVVHIPRQRSILLVNNSQESPSFTSYIAPALEAARKTNARILFEEKQVNDIEQGTWTDYDGLILNGLTSIPAYWHQGLSQYVQDGGGILFLPSEQGEIENYNQFFSLFNAGQFDNVMGEYGSFETITKMGGLEEGHPILDGIFNKEKDEEIRVDLPSLFYYYHYEPASNSNSLTLLEAANNDVLLAEHRFGEGMLLISTLGADPGWSNFPVNPLFAPMYYRTILYASSPERGGLQQHQLGKTFEWEEAISETDITLSINGTDYKPEVQRQSNGMKIVYEGREWEPGILEISAGDQVIQVAVNQNIMESHFDTLEEEEWRHMLDDEVYTPDIIAADDLSNDKLDEQLRSSVFGKEIWNWFIWIALLFLVTETLVTRLYKAESTS
ncbi:BatA domain-containing protein [Fodinibius sp.]|uniref:BatA domain-containing protein n=1 Tax=Fodinibius sp. TaxID=1872440 RepID=UPI002ACE565A|nr:BatA domain-containing protein [Fodinibius sp.]MDZ7658568.1 BatA domain-containing protein [Fodinibius sp.]